MRWLITGATGMVGTDVRAALRERDADVIAVGREELDISDRDAVLYLMKNARPDVVVNCAAFTKVDDCEAREEHATKINGEAVGFLAEGANRWSSLLVHLSTDFVFDGSSTSPYEVNHPVAPLSAYGRSKLAGESEAKKADRHVIIRTSWLFGTSGWNFVEAIRKQVLAGKKELRVVNDQRGCPTYTPHLAQAILRLAHVAKGSPDAAGVYHYSDTPECSWFDFAEAIIREMEAEGTASGVVVHPATSAEMARPAHRPAYSVLSTSRYERMTGVAPESWEDGLHEYFVLTSEAARAS